jgi:hypothetical protein
MTFSFRLDKDLEARIRRAAKTGGLNLSDYVRQTLAICLERDKQVVHDKHRRKKGGRKKRGSSRAV